MPSATRFQRVLWILQEVSDRKNLEAQYNSNVVGEPGIRDRMNLCESFDYGPASGDCWSDGHYMCKECKNLDPTRPKRYD